MGQSRLFAGIYLAACAAALAAALVVNWLGNGTRRFPSPLYPSFTERAWKTRRLDDAVQAGRPPKILVFGSSRVMQIRPKYVEALTGKTAFNYGVGNGGPADWPTEFRYCLSIGCRPEMLLVGIDEDAFRYEYRHGELHAFAHLGLFLNMPFPENVDALAEAYLRIGLETTRESLVTLLRSKRFIPRSVADVENVLLEDGYLIYSNHLRRIEEGTFDLAASISAQRHDKALLAVRARSRECLVRPNPKKLKRLEELLWLARAEGVEVRAMLLPLHPEHQREVLTGQLLLARASLSRTLEGMCAHYGAMYRDFTDLTSFEGDPNEFYDGVHQTSVNTDRMMNMLFGRNPRDVVAPYLPADREILKDLPQVTTLTTP